MSENNGKSSGETVGNGNLKPFPKGVSGNPNGRPKKIPEIDVLLAEVLGENGEEATAILKALLAKAKKGDVRAAEVILDRTYGKAKQDINQKTTIDDQRFDYSKLTQEQREYLAELQLACGMRSE